jgi:hypothetical protein
MTLRYRSKVKLHGMNCGIVINQGEIKLQSRNMFMDGSVQGTSDYAILFVQISNISTYIVVLTSILLIGNKQKGKFFGFDAWALKQKDFFLSLEEPIRKQLKLADDALITLFGEWCGPAVQKGKLSFFGAFFPVLNLIESFFIYFFNIFDALFAPQIFWHNLTFICYEWSCC